VICSVKICSGCPFYQRGEISYCRADALQPRAVDGQPESRPEWCPLDAGPVAVDDRECAPCPFHQQQDKRRCAVATPRLRPMADDEVRPSWCVLRRERFIIRLGR
jgi:hypothetical protein